MLNYPAKLMAIAGFVAGIFGWMILASSLGEGRAARAIAFYIAGGTIALLDLGLRAVQNKGEGWLRFISIHCGGSLLLVVPAWLVGAAIAGGGAWIHYSED